MSCCLGIRVLCILDVIINIVTFLYFYFITLKNTPLHTRQLVEEVMRGESKLQITFTRKEYMDIGDEIHSSN